MVQQNLLFVLCFSQLFSTFGQLPSVPLIRKDSLWTLLAGDGFETLFGTASLFETWTVGGTEVRPFWAAELEASGATLPNTETMLSLQRTNVFQAVGGTDSPVQEQRGWRDCPQTTPRSRIEQKEWRDEKVKPNEDLQENELKNGRWCFNAWEVASVFKKKMAKSLNKIPRSYFLELGYCKTAVAANIEPFRT